MRLIPVKISTLIHTVIHAIDSRPRAAFAAFLSVHFLLWTALPALLYANLPLDLIEAVTYAAELHAAGAPP